MTTALDQPKVITWAGNYWNLPTLPDDQIKWLEEQFDPSDPINQQRYLAPIQAELTRRMPSFEKLIIIEAIKNNAFGIGERFKDELVRHNLLVADLITCNTRGQLTANRLEQGFELAISGRWELPDRPGRAFLVDSFGKEFGSLKYQVKSNNSKLTNFNECSCEDFTYKAAGKFRGFCKHVIAVWIISEALKL